MLEKAHKCISHKHIRQKYTLPFLCALVLFSLCALSQAPCCFAFAKQNGGGDSEQLFSSSVGQRFYGIAYELANSEDVGRPAASLLRSKTAGEVVEQTLTLLTATMRLESRAKYVLPDMIKLACRHPSRDYSKLVYELLVNYVDESVDLEVAGEAVPYVLAHLNSREEREKFLAEMLRNLGGKNKVLDSELATEVGLLMAEKADDPNAARYFWLAYNKNKYNKLAFAKLAELAGDQIKPAILLEHLRLALGKNPADMESALTFAQYAERLQLYETASEAYEYCAALFRFLHPSAALPASLYLPWAISSYNTQRGQYKCLQIASELRQKGCFDLLLEAIAGRAAAKTGDTKEANRILRTAEAKAIGRWDGWRGGGPDNSTFERLTVPRSELAWFYCFAAPDVNNAIEWANKAYSTEPNSATAAAILAYSLVMNGRTELAKLLIDNYERNQIAELTLAQIQLAGEQRSLAIETLKSAIERDPGSLAAERAKAILAEQGGEYVPPVDPDVALTVLRNTFGQAIVPAFVSPGSMVSVQLKLRGDKFSYGRNFEGAVVITNNSSEPLVISEDGLFRGNIRVDAKVSGDIEKEIPNLISVRIRPASGIEPGQSISVPLRLVTGPLRKILVAHPQASLDVEFTVLVDPVVTAEGGITSSFDIEPAKAVVTRPGVELSRRYLQNRLDSLSRGRQGQKIKTIQLFSGLLMEQHAMAGREPLYKLKYADWMPALLKSALLHSLADDDWVVKVHTMVGMLSLPLDYDLTDAVSESLNDTRWPARLMAIYLLAKSPSRNFSDVLDWTARYDSNTLVRQMAVALGGKEPQREPGPAAVENTPVELGR